MATLMSKSTTFCLLVVLGAAGCSAEEPEPQADTGGTSSSGGASSGGSATGGAATGGYLSTGGVAAPTGGQASGGTATGGTASGGKASGGTGACSAGAPPSNYQQTIDLTWKEMTGGFEGQTGARPVSASILTFKNTIIDMLMATSGTLRYCVRWDSTGTLSSTQRDQIGPALERWINNWFQHLVGYDCWPYGHIPVTVTGYATRDRNLLGWTDNTVPVYVGLIRENAPECDSNCGRFFHQQSGYQYPSCSGGFNNHYDMSLWLTDGFSGGVGGDWGQRASPQTVLNNLSAANQIIVMHEMGHGIGFPDYYNWSVWAPGVAAPNTIMNAGASSVVTDWDMWMIRWEWSKVKGAKFGL